jgi:hypothetical protein
MDAVRQAVSTFQQIAEGESRSRKWMVTSGTVTIEAYFEEDAGTTCTDLIIELEGSLTGLNYFTLAAHKFTKLERTNKCAMFHVIDKPIMWLKTNIVTLTKTGAGDVKVTINLLSYD